MQLIWHEELVSLSRYSLFKSYATYFNDLNHTHPTSGFHNLDVGVGPPSVPHLSTLAPGRGCLFIALCYPHIWSRVIRLLLSWWLLILVYWLIWRYVMFSHNLLIVSVFTRPHKLSKVVCLCFSHFWGFETRKVNL